ncbi:hypothetical protein [Pseudotabrizicola sediminis]|uniref:hypothetical protein n=1 Tax=Pseudotabrizicola sediminis TaxID=2486418 RepID=UPI001FDA4A9E|nr:hypothetical protein [Pseudotabrizicola sediminis]
MALQQEMSQLMGDAEPRGLRSAAGIDKYLARAPDPVGEQNALAAIQFFLADLGDPQLERNLVDWHSAAQRPDLPVDCLCQALRVMDVGEIEAVEVQKN